MPVFGGVGTAATAGAAATAPAGYGLLGMLGPAAGFGLSLGLPFLSNYLGQSAADEFNSREAEKAYQRALQFDRTKYGRAVRGLKRAGLNPILAVGGGFGGGSATASQAASSRNPYGNITPQGLASTAQAYSTIKANAEVARNEAKASKLLEPTARAILQKETAEVFRKVAQTGQVTAQTGVAREDQRLKSSAAEAAEIDAKFWEENPEMRRLQKTLEAIGQQGILGLILGGGIGAATRRGAKGAATGAKAVKNKASGGFGSLTPQKKGAIGKRDPIKRK